MTKRLATILAATGFAALSTAATDCAAVWDVRYEGPDAIALVERPTGRTTRPVTHERQLAKGRLASALEPILANALEPCVPSGSGMATVKASQAIDHIGETATRIGGLGLYLNLPGGDRASSGNFYIAPYFALTVTFAPEGGAPETAELFEFNRVDVDPAAPITQDKFVELPVGNLMPTLLNFMKARLPEAMHRAFPNRCPAA
jgi:hypothetical protein